MGGLEKRLQQLENRLCGQLSRDDDDETNLTDEEEADRVGDYLWWPKGDELDRHPAWFNRCSSADGPLRAWSEAAEQARQEGHRDYHIGLRPFAMAVWLDWKPFIVELRQTHGSWVWDDPPSHVDAMTREELETLDVGVLARLTRESNQRRGHWSKHGSQ